MSDDDSKPRRSREAWPEPLDLDKVRYPEPQARQRLVPWVIVYTAIVLLLICVALIFVYILGRGHARDVENRQTQQQTRELIRRGMCDLLDQLPSSAVLDGPRKKYGCGPGIPVDQLPPAVREHYSGATSTTAPATSTPATPTTAPPAQQARSTGVAGGATGAPSTTAGVPPPTRAGVTVPPTPVDPLLCKLTDICEVLP